MPFINLHREKEWKASKSVAATGTRKPTICNIYRNRELLIPSRRHGSERSDPKWIAAFSLTGRKRKERLFAKCSTAMYERSSRKRVAPIKSNGVSCAGRHTLYLRCVFLPIPTKALVCDQEKYDQRIGDLAIANGFVRKNGGSRDKLRKTFLWKENHGFDWVRLLATSS
jgi:hypothetical protein